MKRSSIGFVVFMVVAIGVIYGLSRLTLRKEEVETSPATPPQLTKTTKTEQVADSPFPSSEVTIYGPKDAKVKVVAIIPPSGCQMPNFKVLKEIAEAEPKRVRIEIYNMNSEKAYEVASQYGATCASIFVNDKNQFTIKSGDETRNVIFKQSPGGYYQSADLIEVVHEELKKSYGKGFNEKTLQELRAKSGKFVGGYAGEEVSTEKPKLESKVVVVVLTPSQVAPIYSLFSSTIERLEQLKEKYGDDLSVVVYPLMSEEGQRKMRELKLNGPAVIINGKTTHEIQGRDGKKRTIVTSYGSEPSLFSESDIEEIVEAYMQQTAKK